MKFLKIVAVIFSMVIAVAAQTNMGPTSIGGGAVISNSSDLAQTGQSNTYAPGTAQTGAFIDKGGQVYSAQAYTGADICAQIAAALAAMPAQGGTVDARGFQGAQSCSSNPLAALGGRPVRLLLGAYTITSTATWQTAAGAGNSAHVWIDGVCGGENQGSLVPSATIIKWAGATSASVVNFHNAADSGMRCVTIDADSVSGVNGLLIDSDNNPSSSRLDFSHITINNAHQGFVCGDPTSATTVTTQTDSWKLTDFVIRGSGTDATANGVYVNSTNCAQAAEISSGYITNVNKGVNVFRGGGYWEIKHLLSGTPSTGAADKEFISISSNIVLAPALTQNHTESSGLWTLAVHDSTCNSGSPQYPESWRGNDFNHSISIDGCGRVISMGNSAVNGTTITWTVGGTARVLSIGDWNGGAVNKWVTSGSGAVDYIAQNGQMQAAIINFTTASGQIATTGSQLDLAATNGPIRLNRLGSGTIATQIYKNGTANLLQQTDQTNGTMFYDGAGNQVASVNTAGKGTFNGGVIAGASGSTISDTRELFQSVHYCGSTGTCANTANIQARHILGTITLAAGAATLSGIPAASNLILCTCTDQTTTSACKAVQATSTSVAFSGSTTDTLGFQCDLY